LAGDENRAIREREHCSLPVFAATLTVSRNLVSDWERGVKCRGGSALRSLSTIQRKGLGGACLRWAGSAPYTGLLRPYDRYTKAIFKPPCGQDRFECQCHKVALQDFDQITAATNTSLFQS